MKYLKRFVDVQSGSTTTEIMGIHFPGLRCFGEPRCSGQYEPARKSGWNVESADDSERDVVSTEEHDRSHDRPSQGSVLRKRGPAVRCSSSWSVGETMISINK